MQQDIKTCFSLGLVFLLKQKVAWLLIYRIKGDDPPHNIHQ